MFFCSPAAESSIKLVSALVSERNAGTAGSHWEHKLLTMQETLYRCNKEKADMASRFPVDYFIVEYFFFI